MMMKLRKNAGSSVFLTHGAKKYIALNPLGSEDVYIYGYKEHGEDYDLIYIKDDEEFEKVVAEFEKLAAEEA